MIAKSEQVFEFVERTVNFNQRNRRVDEMPSIQKKETVGKKVPKTFIERSFYITKWTQTTGTVVAERIEPFEKTEIDGEIEKT